MTADLARTLTLLAGAVIVVVGAVTAQAAVVTVGAGLLGSPAVVAVAAATNGRQPDTEAGDD
jgi:hypothetical protein